MPMEQVRELCLNFIRLCRLSPRLHIPNALDKASPSSVSPHRHQRLAIYACTVPLIDVTNTICWHAGRKPLGNFLKKKKRKRGASGDGQWTGKDPVPIQSHRIQGVVMVCIALHTANNLPLSYTYAAARLPPML